MATHQPPSGLKQEDEEFVPYEPSLLYPFFLSATAVRLQVEGCARLGDFLFRRTWIWFLR